MTLSDFTKDRLVGSFLFCFVFKDCELPELLGRLENQVRKETRGWAPAPGLFGF